MSDKKDFQPPKSGPFVRKKLTPFLAHEMIYDYSMGQLDPERRAALEEFLAKDQESQNLLKNIEIAQSYTAKLSRVTVDAEVLEQLAEAESAVSLGKRYSSWREWPETLRWSITAIVMSGVLAGAVALVPWSKFSFGKKPGSPESVEVAQIAQPKLEDTEVAANEDNGSGDEAPDDSNDEGSGDDVADNSASHAAAAVAAVAPVPTSTPTPQVNPAVVTAKPSGSSALGKTTPAPFVAVNLPKSTAPVAPSSSPAGAGTNASARVAMSETDDSHSTGDSKAKGFVYRAFMTLDNLEEIAPKIKDDLVSLGAEKAGEVELGWKRGTGHYYHFALPEENQKKVIDRLQVYGPVRISKDPHPRVMPPGKVRFILWVESTPE